MRNSIFIGALLAAIASISWGAMFPVANHAFQYISPFYFTLIRYIPVAIILV
ncbi:MAG TPA: EamA family transporter, partial [Pseudogracilibacillus sp.]|nr:EamA family transporter [Pseudogracilibacillus sp.]